MRLFVVNDGEPERVTSLSAPPSLSSVEALFVESYTREASVLAARPSGVFHLAPEAGRESQDSKQFRGFLDYLRKRAKAAVCRTEPKGFRVVLLPPSAEVTTETELSTVINATRTRAEDAGGRTNAVDVKSEEAQAMKSEASAVKSVEDAGMKKTEDGKTRTAAVRIGPAQIQQMLQSSAKAADPSRRLPHNRLRPTVDAAAALGRQSHRAAVLEAHRASSDEITDLANRERLRAQMEAFVADHSRTRLVFPPMYDRMDRYYVHEVADDFDELTSKSDGEGEEKHVVVYKKGHMPDEEAQVGLLPGAMRAERERVQRQARSKAKKMKEQRERKMLEELAKSVDAGGSIEAVRKQKRDRRTIEEIDEDRKRAKKKEMDELFGAEDDDDDNDEDSKDENVEEAGD